MNIHFRSILGALTSGSGKRYSLWAIIIGVTLLGGNVLKNHFGLWAVLVVGIVGTFVGARYVLRNRNTIRETHGVRARKTVSQNASAWDYRPRNSSLRNSTVSPNVGVETTYTSSSSNPVPNENADVWFNFANQESDT